MRESWSKTGLTRHPEEVKEVPVESNSSSITSPAPRRLVPRESGYVPSRQRRWDGSLYDGEGNLAVTNEDRIRPVDSPMEPYEYTPLKKSSVRLLSFHPDADQLAKIPICTLQNFSFSTLSQSGMYDAISYVWGEPDFSETLLCDDIGSYLNITPRLYSILMALREKSTMSGHISRFWVDAICINQEDSEERNHQVQEMAKIYRRADRVHVFLGENPETPNGWLNSAWFTRRWVIQEFITSREVVVHKNGIMKSWESFTFEIDAEWNMANFSSGLRTVLALREFKSTGSKWSGILSLLLKFHSAECRDDRDRLFAFFGIANDVVLEDENKPRKPGTSKRSNLFGSKNPMIKFKVDYRLSTPEVYVNFARAVLESVMSMDILHVAAVFRPSSSPKEGDTGGIPSWAPDLHLPPLYMPLMKATEYQAGISSSYKTPNISIKDDKVIVCGYSLTSVKSTINPWPSDLSTSAYVGYAISTGDTNSNGPGHNLSLTSDRVAFVTTNGSYGAAPPDVLPEDEIVVFFGARTPFILRRVPLSDNFRLIGDCFLEGVMKGEAMEKVMNVGEEKHFTIV
jgi:hypothetical protein